MLSVFLDRDSLDSNDIDFSALQRCSPGWRGYAQTAPEQVMERIRDADIVICNKVVLDRAVLSAAAQLKLVCVTATGTNNVDVQAARERGIVVSNARGYATPSVVEHVFTLLGMLLRHLPDYQRAATDGRWQQSPHFCYFGDTIHELAGKTLGIVGYGELGRAVASVAKAFGMRVLIAERPGHQQCREGRMPLQALLPQVDVLSLHCPLADNTRHLIEQRTLALMQPHAVLINTARGGIVNEQDLLEALRSGRIAGAALDVLEQEPPQPDNALIRANLPKLIITPHVAWASRESRQRLLAEVVANIEAFQQGSPRNQVLP